MTKIYQYVYSQITSYTVPCCSSCKLIHKQEIFTVDRISMMPLKEMWELKRWGRT